ncbi:probable splicing factor, arginine/serine-rich 7 [Wyeomyia smithii]|uniref:probable splicing factor, arginine/serine-rich 7 n=1 Tax=Wyeomyia smithii TaxID=174621 RepID=UPI0024680038|nr:probable splicing factor, arginine/serine-rich 7 [Wyeomyia smithii]XP_055541484.1 probable splicing factor, arginine/serine-rich 7 [Wyeomyia smithii]
MAGGTGTKVVQITNIAPQATKDQMQSLFGHIGKIDEIRLYPTIRDVSCPVVSRICYVKYFESSCVAVAQHLTNTVFIDRALIVIPVQSGMIPDEYKALEMAANGTLVPGLHNIDAPSKLPPEVVNRIDGMVPNQVVKTIDPKLDENNLPEYPPLPVNFDAKKIEETRRTILVLDIKSDWRLEDLMDHFKSAGEIKYARFAENDRSRYALMEFCEQRSIISALKLQGSDFRGYRLNVHHSTQPIVKPEAKSNEAAQKEIEEAMSIVKEAHSMISAAIDPVIGMLAKDKSSSRRRSRSHSRSKDRRSRSRSRKRSKSRSKRSRSRKRSHSRSKRSRSRSKHSHTKRSTSRSKRSRSRSKRSRSRDRRKRSRSRNRSRSRSRDRRRSRSRSNRKRSRSRERRDRSRDRKKTHRNKEERRRRSRSRSRSRKRSSSRSRSSRTKDSTRSSKKRSRSPDKRLKKILEESVSRDYDAEERIGGGDDDAGASGNGNGGGSESSSVMVTASKGSPPPPREKATSPTAETDNMDISNSP